MLFSTTYIGSYKIISTSKIYKYSYYIQSHAISEKMLSWKQFKILQVSIYAQLKAVLKFS